MALLYIIDVRKKIFLFGIFFVILQLDFDSRNPEALCLDLVPEKSEKFSETHERWFSTCAMRGLLSISCFKVHFSLPFGRGLAYSTTLLLLYVFSQLVLERKIKLHTTRISGEKLKKTLFYSLIILTELLFVATFTCCDKDDNANTNNGGVNIAIDADPNKYIDLGLPSGTKWKNSNESGFYDFELATKTFGNNLPTKEQLEELVSYCTYTWDKNKKGGYFVSSVNGNSIFLPAEGERDGTDLRLDGNGFVGNYWSSTINNSNSDYVWYLGLHSSVFIYSNKSKKNWCSVRLVHN